MKPSQWLDLGIIYSSDIGVTFLFLTALHRSSVPAIDLLLNPDIVIPQPAGSEKAQS